MWCPKCRNEYREGITECADCHIPLVEELPIEEEESKDCLDEDFANWAKKHPDNIPYDNTDEKISVAQTLAELEKPVKPYKSNAEKAADFKSSGYTLIAVGGAGLIAMVLIIMGIIPLNLASNVKYLSYGTMSVLFLIFFVVGIKSMKSAKEYQREAEIENALEKEIHDWFLESFPLEDIDGDTFSGDEESTIEIEKYYRRTENMRQKISSKYNDIDPAFLDKMADELYHEIYEA